jgi:2-oxoisovalerate dehydrogenase E1 component subunit alpha
LTTIASFEIPFTRCLDRDGRPAGRLPAFAEDPAELVRLYRAMTLTRAFDQRAVALQRAGQLGTYASSLGQEAAGVGVASAMRADDVLVPSFREHGAQLWRGVTLLECFLAWGGDERGFDVAGPREDFPAAVPVASHVPHAAGVALAFKLRHEARVAVCTFGDGATSKGDFYEGINMAGGWRLPCVFVAVNNQWAISVPRARQTASETLAQKAVAAGIVGEQVDGNDVIAVRDAAERAIARARAGDGPTLIEALTYRLADHTTADDASRYREAASVEAAWQDEPLLRLRRYLGERRAWSAEDERALRDDSTAQVEAAVAAYLATPPQPPGTIFDYQYAALPAELARQRGQLVAEAGDG